MGIEWMRWLIKSGEEYEFIIDAPHKNIGGVSVGSFDSRATDELFVVLPC